MRFGVPALVLVLALPLGAAQSPRDPSIVLTVDFSAMKDGRHVTDLTTADLTLRIDGRERPIRSLRTVEVTSSSPAILPASLPLAFASNAVPELGRTLLVVIDNLSMRPGRERPFRDAMRQLIASLSPRDRVALAIVPFDGLTMDFSTNHEVLLAKILALTGQAPRTETVGELACRSKTTLDAFRGLLQGLEGGVGPTTVLFVSSGLAGPGSFIEPRLDPRAVSTQFAGQCEIRPTVFRDFETAAAAARATVYVVEPDDAARAGVARAGLEHVAGMTGGEMIYLVGAGEDGLGRIVRNTAAYYLLTFDASGAERNGIGHRMDVRSRRRDVTIRARPQVVIPRLNPRAIATSVAPREMMQSSRVFRDLPLRAAAYASRNPGTNSLLVVGLAEPIERGVDLSSAMAGLFDREGRLVAQWTSVVGEVATGPIVAALSAPPGWYRLRVAASDGTGRGGTADYEISAALTPAGPNSSSGLEVSSLLLGLSRDGGFVPRLLFSSEPVAIGYVEVYGARPASLAVQFELARTINGRALVTVAGAVTDTRDADRIIVTGAIPVGGYEPGDFVARAIITVDGQQTARVVRALRKEGQ